MTSASLHNVLLASVVWNCCSEIKIQTCNLIRDKLLSLFYRRLRCDLQNKHLMPDRTMLYSSLKGNSGIFLQRFCIQVYRMVNGGILLPLHKYIKIMDCSDFWARMCNDDTWSALGDTDDLSVITDGVCVRLDRLGSFHPLLWTFSQAWISSSITDHCG